jgi:amino acid permease
MNKVFSAVLLVVGVVLTIYGISGTDSLSSDISRFFTGSPTDESIWLLIAGIFVAIMGATGLMRRSRSA